MTFSIAATDGKGRYGIAVCSSSPAVAARCTHLQDAVGAVSSQNITDPRLGPLLLESLREGNNAEAALQLITASTTDIDYRQLVVLDAEGRGAYFNGTHVLGLHDGSVGQSCVAAGNMLATTAIPGVLCTAFEASNGDLEDRLLAALNAAVAAGGEAGPVHSAGLAVTSGYGWRDTDLRVDWSDDPVGDLEGLLSIWMPQRQDYINRGLRPASSVGYGVPGDQR